MSLEINTSAPAFSLYDTEKQKVSLDDQRGKNVLLLFFPLAFTSTCTSELCDTRDNMTVYSSLNAEVFGISVDSLFALKKFKEEQQLNFSLLSDFNKTVSKQYDSLYEQFGFEMLGVGKRSAFVINENGFIKYKEVLENAADVPDFNKIKEVLEILNKG